MSKHKIQSPQSGVTLCFQFVSAASASAAAKTFPSHVKAVWAKPLIFGTKNIWVWGNVLDDLSMTLTKVMAVASISKNLLVCAIKWEPLIGSLQNVSALLPQSDDGHYLIGFWSNSVENCYFGKFSLKISDVFFQGQTQFWPYLRNGWSDWCETKMKCIAWTLGTIYDLDLSPSLMTLTLYASRSNFEIALSLELLVWLMWNEKEVS